MNGLRVSALPHSGVLYLYSDRDSIQLDPTYQRAGDIWSQDKRQLLIDSILNGYDIPKFYFHKFSRPEEIAGKRYSYAIIDGKQRLTSIWSFIDGDFPLSDAAEYLEDSNVKISGLTYSELGAKYPKLKMRFDAYTLSVMCVETEDLELIEDMFSRLNEAVPLSAAEKRNAFGGDVPLTIRAIARWSFFSHNLPFGNKRYKHLDLATKFLLIEARDRVVDTKKAYLDAFVRDWTSGYASELKKAKSGVDSVLREMGSCFTKDDVLLRSVGMVSLYYHLFRIGLQKGWRAEITRNQLKQFDVSREVNRNAAESDISTANYDLLEFDRYAQSPNDGYAMSIRLRILLQQVFGRKLDSDYGVGGKV